MEGTPEMEAIMAKISPYLKEGTHNYNRTWEAIQEWKNNLIKNERISQDLKDSDFGRIT